MVDDAPGGADDLEAAAARYLRAEASGAYRATAGPVLDQFWEWCERRDVGLDTLNDPEQGPIRMRRYAERLGRRVRGDGITASSARTYWHIIRGFLSFCVRDGLLDRNPAKTARAEEPLPTETEDRQQQFWTPEARQRILGFVDEQAHEAIDADPRSDEARRWARDRTAIYLLAYAGVRGAEVFSHPRDDRKGRQGLRWSNVDTDEWASMRIYRKVQSDESDPWEWAAIPRQARSALRRWHDLLDPPTDEWPVFPTGHAPSKYDTAKQALQAEGHDAEAATEIVREDGTAVDELLRDLEAPPPAITTDAMRRRLQQLCERAGIEIDGEYLKLHGARRGIGETVYRQDPTQASELLGHKSVETTRRAYAHLDVEQQAEQVSDLIDDEER